MNNTQLATERLLRLRDVCDKVGLSRSTVYFLESRGLFPGRVKLGRATAWSELEVDRWIEAALSERAPKVQP